MTEIRLKVLTAINEYIEREKISPTVRELTGIVGLKSTSSIHRHIDALEKEGYISRIKESPRSLRVLKTC